MTKKKAIEILQEIEVYLGNITNNNKQSEKAWDDVVKASQTILELLK